MNLFKKLASLNYRKDILPLQVLKEPKKIFVLLPLEPYEPSSFIPAIELLRKSFETAEITGVTKAEYAPLFEKSNIFNKVVSYESTPFSLSRQFFRLRSKLRDISAPMSVDFNTESDLLSWIGGASLRIGSQSSPFINYKVKLSSGDQSQNAIKLVRAVCIGH
jgi:ADP-heptose:LPS heptosyltransferase